MRWSIPFRKPSKETSIEIDEESSLIIPLDVFVLWSRLRDWVKLSVVFFLFFVGESGFVFLWSLSDAAPASSSLFSITSDPAESNGYGWAMDGSRSARRVNQLTKEDRANRSNHRQPLCRTTLRILFSWRLEPLSTEKIIEHRAKEKAYLEDSIRSSPWDCFLSFLVIQSRSVDTGPRKNLHALTWLRYRWCRLGDGDGNIIERLVVRSDDFLQSWCRRWARLFTT